MSDAALIPAAPGWRYVYFEREFDGICALPVVAWERDERHPGQLVPYVADYAGQVIGIPPADDWFVGFAGPGQEMDRSWEEAGQEIAKAEREAEARAERHAALLPK
jgi:hypothetical protein